MLRGLAILACTIWSLRADADRIVFVNVSRDTTAGQAAIGELRESAQAGGITIVDDPIAMSLAGRLVAGDAEVRDHVEQAKQALVRFDYDAVYAHLRAVEAHYGRVGPSGDAAIRLAELNLMAGVAQAGQGKDATAIESFRLVRRLDATRTKLDPAIYPPRLVELFDRAGRPSEGSPAPLQATLSPPNATLWIDGHVGAASELAAGEHYLGALAVDHAGSLTRVTVRSGASLTPAIRLVRLAPVDQANRARASVAAGTNVALHAARIAELAQVEVVAIVKQDEQGSIAAALWQRNTLGAFEPVRDVAATLSSWRLRSTLVPAATTTDVSQRDQPPSRPFWRTGWGLTLIGTAAILVTGGIILATRDEERGFQIGPPCFNGTSGC